VLGEPALPGGPRPPGADDQKENTKNNFDTTGRKLPLPKARYEAPEPWKDADQKQLLQLALTGSWVEFH
jgi:hypothetical protein